MFKFIVFLFLLLPFTTYANLNIKAISGVQYFPPTPYSNTAMKSASLRGGVNINGNFGIARINASSMLGLGKQLAKGNPYTLAAMAALAYYQDDLGQWLQPPEKEGEPTPVAPQVKQRYELTCNISAWGFSNTGQVSANNDFPSTITSKCKPLAIKAFKQKALANGYASAKSISSTDTTITFLTTTHSGQENTQSASFSGRFSQPIPTPQCPPDSNPDYTQPQDSTGNGDVDKCFNPSELEQYQPKPVTSEDMVEPYADDLMKWQSTSVDAMQKWEPFTDSNGNVESEYVDSYNIPDVSPTMNEYMKNVASNNYQTIDANAPNYVPAEMVQPVQTAISSSYNDMPFVDPTTNQVTSPTTSTDGAATPEPSPTGSANSPLHVTGDITVNVEIPEDDTLSQTEYEQSNAEFFNQFDTQAQLEQTRIDTQLTDLQTADLDFIDSLTPDVTNFGVPDFPTLANIWPSFQTGVCIPLSLNASVGRIDKTLTFDAHCPPYNTYIHPLLVWLLYMTTGLYIFHLAAETLGRK